jgi:hypothetical protein
MITTRDAAAKHLMTCVYDVRGIADITPGKSIDFDSLIDTIVSCIETESWSENGGGEAEIRPLSPGLLVISQTRAVHGEIRELLESIREMRGRQPAAGDAAGAPGVEQVVTRSYVLQIGKAEGLEKVRTEVRELIVNSIPDERWAGRLEDGQAVVLSVLPDRVVVRHRPSVQDQVEALLGDSGVAVPHENRKRGGSSGGGFDVPRGAGDGLSGNAAESEGSGFFNARSAQQ